MDPAPYLDRVGLSPADAKPTDLRTLARLQRAHVTAVPFETLSITGHPYGDREGEGVSLVLPDLYRKIVARERGGFCFELNGLFGWLLSELGLDADRVAARVLGDDGTGRPPANHHAHVVTLDRAYLVDVGLGTPQMRRPLPLDGSVREDEAGVAWRAVESDRPDAEYLTQYREPGDGWRDRYLLDTTPRPLTYFEATCDYLATAPESPFTGDPVVSIATERGYRKLTPGTLTRVVGEDGREEEVPPEAWDDVLRWEFGLRYRESAASSFSTG